MVDIVTRTLGDTAKNAPLTNEEVDKNFLNLNAALDDAPVEELLAYIRSLQIGSGPAKGAIRVNLEPSSDIGGEPCYLVDVFAASLAVWQLLEVCPTRVKKLAYDWLDFCTRHWGSSDGIPNADVGKTSGTVHRRSYNGVLRDSETRNTAMFLLVAARYEAAFGGLPSNCTTVIDQILTNDLPRLLHNNREFKLNRSGGLETSLLATAEAIYAIKAVKAAFNKDFPVELSSTFAQSFKREGGWIAGRTNGSAWSINLQRLNPDLLAQVWPVLFGLEDETEVQEAKIVEMLKSNTEDFDVVLLALGASKTAFLPEAMLCVNRRLSGWDSNALKVSYAAAMIRVKKSGSDALFDRLLGQSRGSSGGFDTQGMIYIRPRMGIGLGRGMSDAHIDGGVALEGLKLYPQSGTNDAAIYFRTTGLDPVKDPHILVDSTAGFQFKNNSMSFLVWENGLHYERNGVSPFSLNGSTLNIGPEGSGGNGAIISSWPLQVKTSSGYAFLKANELTFSGTTGSTPSLISFGKAGEIRGVTQLALNVGSTGLKLTSSKIEGKGHGWHTGSFAVVRSISNVAYPQVTSSVHQATAKSAMIVGLDMTNNENQSVLSLHAHSSNLSTLKAIEFYFARNSTAVGSIRITSSSTQLQTSSDYRLKTQVTDFNRGVETCRLLRPVGFVWKSDGRADVGFLAHELQDVVPNAVSGQKDEVDKDGKMIPQTISKETLVPYLVSAVKELDARLQQLEEMNGKL